MKMKKRGLLEKLPIFRTHINNELPWLGNLPHTPIHLYVSKNGDQIQEIKLIDSPLAQNKTDSFLNVVNSKIGKSEIKIDVLGQRSKHLKMQDLETNFNIDFDDEEGYVSLAERKRKEK